MTNILKQIFSFILPITVLVVVPLSIEKNRTVLLGIHFFSGLTLILFGLTLMTITISSFIRIGKGTLAPWAPTKRLVIKGPYRYVRNPMILGVMTVLLGEALGLWSKNILIWTGAFILINTVYFLFYEEPNLEKRFGEEYRIYKKHVPRWLPRLTGYQPEKQNEL